MGLISLSLSLCVSRPDEREAVQKKTFTKWVNSHLSRVSCRITDLYMDLRDGRMLIKLLEVLSGERLVGHISLWAFILKEEQRGKLSVCLSTCLSVCLSTCLSTCLSVCLSVL